MPRAALNAEQIQRFRGRAVAAAAGLFSEVGYGAVTMRAVAGRLGCSPMTPYRYFSNKDELFAEVRRDAFRRFADSQKEALCGRVGKAALPHLGSAYVQFALDDPDAYRIMFELEQPPPGENPELDREVERSFSYFRLALAQAATAGELAGDPLTRAHLLWAEVHGLVSLHLAGKLIMGRTLHELVPLIVSPE